MNHLEELKALITAVEADFTKFYEGNNQAAGTRVRKAMQDLKNLATVIRTDVSTIKNK